MREEKMNRKGTIRSFISYYKPHLRLFVLDMMCALVISLIDLAFPLVTKNAMETYLPNNMYQTFFAVMVIVFVAYIIRTLMEYVVTYYGHNLGVLVEADLRRDLFTHVQDLSFSFFDRNRTGHLMSRITGDLFEITELAHHGPEDLFISCVTLFGALAVMLTIEWRLALIVFSLVPVLVMLTVFQRGKMDSASSEVKEKLAGINGDVESSLSGMRTAKAYANEEYEIQKFSASNDRFKRAKRGYYKALAVYHSGFQFLMSLMNVVAIAAGGYFILRGELTYIGLITFNLYISTFLSPIRRLASFVEQYTAGMAGFRRFRELMSVEPEIKDAPDAVEMGGVRGGIEFEDVSFYYKEDKTVLEHVNLKISSGETLAIVGPSGGGKTTLCQLIPRFYDVKEGRVLIDGADIRTVTQKSLRRNIGIVQQDVFLFAGTVKDNICYGRADATMEEIEEAARKAEMHDDIMAMPDGYDTYIGERGILLSGGQRQRISIARVFLKNPPILILDEATSSLDSITESNIQHSFEALAKGRTTIVIAHRLSTVRSADMIAVIDDDGISEYGAHEELMRRNGRYAALARAQRLS